MACLAAKPVVDGLERELGRRAIFLRADIQTDAGAAIAGRYQVASVPGFVAFDRAGRVIWSGKGPAGAAELGRVLRAAVD